MELDARPRWSARKIIWVGGPAMLMDDYEAPVFFGGVRAVRGAVRVCERASHRDGLAEGLEDNTAAAPKPPKKIPGKPAPEAKRDGWRHKRAPTMQRLPTRAIADKPDKGDPSTVKAAGTNATKTATPAVSGVTTKEDKSGVKTYKFGTIEVEGRMKSPQIIYFLRRVRAEFDAGALGHRSFMRELSDTRNNPSLR